MKIYKSCRTLPIGRFFRIFETDDFRNLIIDFDEENNEIEITQEQALDLAAIFEDIFYEYSELSHNYKLRSLLKRQLLISDWEITYSLVTNLIDIYEKHKDIEALLLLNQIDGFSPKFDVQKDINKQLEYFKRKMKGLGNRIKIFKIKVVKAMKDNKKEVKIDLDKDALYLERNLDLKREINPETTSVAKWLKLIEMNESKIKAQKQNSRRHATN